MRHVDWPLSQDLPRMGAARGNRPCSCQCTKTYSPRLGLAELLVAGM